MKKLMTIALTGAFALGAMTFTACDKGGDGGDDGNKQIVLPDQNQKNQQAFADDQTTGGFTFTAKQSWTATVAETTRASGVAWLRLLLDGEETYSGAAGTFNLVIELDENYSGKPRTATITIVSGADRITITVTQDGETVTGTVPEKPRLVSLITESAQFTSDYYEYYDRAYNPRRYEFKYDERDRVKEHRNYFRSGTNAMKLTFDYGIKDEIRVTNSDNDETLTVTLNPQGYVSKWTYDEQSGDYTTMTYDADGYVTGASVHGDQPGQYRFNWSDGNLTSTEGQFEDGTREAGVSLTYSSHLNSPRVNLDLNWFVDFLTNSSLYYDEGHGINDPETILSMADRLGKRSKNYVAGATYPEGMDPEWPLDIHTQASLPASGTVVSTYYDREYYGGGTWTLDGAGCPTSYSHKAEVVKTRRIYNGAKSVVTPRNEYEAQEWLERYGPGPYYTIDLDESETVKYDTYTWTITYKE
jgi:hypothetical protein